MARRNGPRMAKFDDEAVWRGLWCAVLVQMLMDARSQSAKSDAIHAKREALSWLRGGRDFETVCLFADLNPQHIQGKIQNALTRQWRLPAGQGWRTQQRIAQQGATNDTRN